MKISQKLRWPGVLLGLGLVSFPMAAQACTACMGDPNSKSAGAINAAIFLMIGVIGTMLGSLGVFALYLKRRADTPLPPHLELAESLHAAEEAT